jgi:hypothetical protein
MGIFSIPAYSGKDKPIIFSEELIFGNKRVKACAFDARQRLAAKRFRAGNDYLRGQERLVVIGGYYEIAVFKFFSGDENHSALKELALG